VLLHCIAAGGDGFHSMLVGDGAMWDTLQNFLQGAPELPRPGRGQVSGTGGVHRNGAGCKPITHFREVCSGWRRSARLRDPFPRES